MMYSYAAAMALAGSVSATVLPRTDGCCFQLTASGGESGTIGQLSDGQNRIGGGYTPATYCINNGETTDSDGRGCILTPPTTQFQCDVGATPTSGFSISGSGQVEYNGSGKFYACGASDTEYNLYTTPVENQANCHEITLSSGGKCASNGGGGGASSAASSAPAASSASSMPSNSAPSVYSSEAPKTSSAKMSSKASMSSPIAASSEMPKSSPTPASSPASMPASSQPAPSQPASSPAVCPPAVTITVTETQPCASGASPAPSGPAASAPPVGGSAPPVGGSAPPVGGSAPPAPSSAMSSEAPKSSPVAASSEAPKSSPASTPAAQPSSIPKGSTMPAPYPSSKAGDSTKPAVSAGTAAPPAVTGSASPSGTGTPVASPSGACQTSLTGAYQTPHLIVPISSDKPDAAQGTSYNGQINSTTSTIFNFDVPADYEGKQCSIIFLFPQKQDLETSDYTFGGSGSLGCSELSSAADEKTSWSNAPSVAKDLGDVSIQPGNSYVVSSGDCKAGTTQSIELASKDGLSLDFFEDWNPSPLGLYMTSC